jgi:hypothetical protein
MHGPQENKLLIFLVYHNSITIKFIIILVVCVVFHALLNDIIHNE